MAFFIACNNDNGKSWNSSILKNNAALNHSDSRSLGSLKFSCMRIKDESDSIKSDFTILFKIENVEKPIHPFYTISNSTEQVNSVGVEFFKSIETRFSLEFDGKVQYADVCIDRNVDKSKPFIDLLVIFKNPDFNYSNVELTFEDNIFDIGKVIIPLTAI
jgi:hypothetical protein